MSFQDLFSRWGDQTPDQILSRASERGPLLVSLLLVAGIGFYLARLVWMVYPPPAEVVWQAPPLQRGQAAATAGPDYSALARAQLFGQPDASEQPLDAQAALDAPDTRLNLQLRATVAAGDSRFAHAIIADGSGNEQAYFLRDSVPGGATLHQVHVDRVILNRGGVLEALRLPREFEGLSGVMARPMPRPGTATSMQQVVEQNAARFMEIVRPQPFMPDGQMRGYRVYPGRDRQQFAALGLRPGDLVTEINGMGLNNPAEGMEIFRSLGDSTQVTVTIERNGQSEVLTLDTSQLAQAGGATQ